MLAVSVSILGALPTPLLALAPDERASLMHRTQTAVPLHLLHLGSKNPIPSPVVVVQVFR